MLLWRKGIARVHGELSAGLDERSAALAERG
jgi:hypothetical protein